MAKAKKNTADEKWKIKGSFEDVVKASVKTDQPSDTLLQALDDIRKEIGKLNKPIGSGIAKEGLENQVGIWINYDSARSLRYKLNGSWSKEIKDKVRSAIHDAALRHPTVFPNTPIEE
jgi:hypothetical protein